MPKIDSEEEAAHEALRRVQERRHREHEYRSRVLIVAAQIVSGQTLLQEEVVLDVDKVVKQAIDVAETLIAAVEKVELPSETDDA